MAKIPLMNPPVVQAKAKSKAKKKAAKKSPRIPVQKKSREKETIVVVDHRLHDVLNGRRTSYCIKEKPGVAKLRRKIRSLIDRGASDQEIEQFERSLSQDEAEMAEGVMDQLYPQKNPVGRGKDVSESMSPSRALMLAKRALDSGERYTRVSMIFKERLEKHGLSDEDIDEWQDKLIVYARGFGALRNPDRSPLQSFVVIPFGVIAGLAAAESAMSAVDIFPMRPETRQRARVVVGFTNMTLGANLANWAFSSIVGLEGDDLDVATVSYVAGASIKTFFEMAPYLPLGIRKILGLTPELPSVTV